MRIVFLP